MFQRAGKFLSLMNIGLKVAHESADLVLRQWIFSTLRVGTASISIAVKGMPMLLLVISSIVTAADVRKTQLIPHDMALL
jgi:hypothetical protein